MLANHVYAHLLQPSVLWLSMVAFNNYATLRKSEFCANLMYHESDPDYTAVASMRRTEALASVKFYQILSIFIFFIRMIILEDFIRLISYNGPCVRLGCSFFLATALD